MALPLQKGFRLVVNLLTMPHLDMLFFCAPNSLKSQDTNFIDSDLKGCISVETTGCSISGSIPSILPSQILRYAFPTVGAPCTYWPSHGHAICCWWLL